MMELSKHGVISLICMVYMLMLNGCGSGGSGTGPPAVANAASAQPVEKLPGTLIIVGNSIMAGCTDSLDQPHASYSMTTAHLIAEKGVHVVNLSRGGNTIALADSQRVDGGINFTQGHPRGTAIWIALGANDFIWELSSLQQYRDHYLTVLSRINPIPKQKIFCVTPLVAGLDLEHRISSEGASYEEYRQVVRDIAKEGHCTLVDTAQWFNSAEIYDGCHMPDTLHLGEDGHIDYSNKLLESIRADYSAL